MATDSHIFITMNAQNKSAVRQVILYILIIVNIMIMPDLYSVVLGIIFMLMLYKLLSNICQSGNYKDFVTFDAKYLDDILYLILHNIMSLI